MDYSKLTKRELVAELEIQRTRNRQLQGTVDELDHEITFLRNSERSLLWALNNATATLRKYQKDNKIYSRDRDECLALAQ